MQGEEVRPQVARPLAAVQAPELAHADLAVAFDPALVGVRDLDLDHEVERRAFDERCGRGFVLDRRRAIPPGPLVEVEGAVRLHPRARRLVPPADARAAESLRDVRRRVHDIVEDPRQILVQVRGRHQHDKPAYRIEADPTEPPVPVDGGQRGHGPGIGVQDVDLGAQRPHVHRGRAADGHAISENVHELNIAPGLAAPATGAQLLDVEVVRLVDDGHPCGVAGVERDVEQRLAAVDPPARSASWVQGYDLPAPPGVSVPLRP